jgi:uncharacterized protein
VRRFAWFCLGWVAVAFAFVGIVVPGLPSVGCFVGAAACFSKSSPRFERWLLDLPKIGPMIRDHRAGLGMPRKAKVIAIAMMTTACITSSVLVGRLPIAAAILATGLVGALYVAFRVPTRRPTVVVTAVEVAVEVVVVEEPVQETPAP